MNTTFDLPDPLLRKAKAAAARLGRPLRDLVAEAIDEKLAQTPSEIADTLPISAERRLAWERWRSRLVEQPDGTWFNPEGIQDEAFYETLEQIRQEAWPKRDRSLLRRHTRSSNAMYLLDTNVLSGVTRPRPNVAVVRRLFSTSPAALFASAAGEVPDEMSRSVPNRKA